MGQGQMLHDVNTMHLLGLHFYLVLIIVSICNLHCEMRNTKFMFLLLEIRHDNPSIVEYGGRLLQQYGVDNYVKIESNNLRWIRHNQEAICT